jgi:hypothetical protein
MGIANYESPRTTKLYDRTNDAINLAERACPAVPGIERILIQASASRGSRQAPRPCAKHLDQQAIY